MDSSANLMGTSHERKRSMRKYTPTRDDNARSSSISGRQDFPTEFDHSFYRPTHYYQQHSELSSDRLDDGFADSGPNSHQYPPAPHRDQGQVPPSITIYPCDNHGPRRVYNMSTPTLESTARLAGFEPQSPSDTLVGSPTRDREKMPWSHQDSTSSPERPSAGEGAAIRIQKSPEHAIESQANASQNPFESSTPESAHQSSHNTKKGMRFWLILISLMVVIALSAIDLTIISTALPTIVKDLGESSISGTWITSAFLLTVTAFQPMMGGLADVMGRRYSLLVSVLLFLGGSVICALAQSILVLVIGRGVQGIGGGGIQAIVEIILSDITTLRERGLYMGAIGLVFAIASLIAPILGGVFSDYNWRWIFWINLPVGGIACALIVPFMKLNTPPMPFKEKLHRMDIFGNLVLMAAVVAILIAVTEGGVEHPWDSLRIWLPLTLGLIGMVAFFVIEFVPNRLARDPILPRRLFSNRTAATSYLLTFLHGIVFYGAVYILPIYHQAIKGQSPLNSAYDILPATAPAAPAAVVAGAVMAITGKYRVQTIAWWAMLVVGCGLLFRFDADTSKAEWVIYELVTGIAVGAIFAVQLPPIQASLPVSEIAHSTATFAFSRSFGSVWGIAIATAIFTAKVDPRLAAIPGARELGVTGPRALALATELESLPAELQPAIIHAYATAIRAALLFFIPVAAAGFLASFFLKDLPLPDFNDTACGITNENSASTVAKAEAGASNSVQDHTLQSVSSTGLPDTPHHAAKLNGQRPFQSTLPPSSSFGSLRSAMPDYSPYKASYGGQSPAGVPPYPQSSVDTLPHNKSVAPMPSLTEVMGSVDISDGGVRSNGPSVDGPFGDYLPGQRPQRH